MSLLCNLSISDSLKKSVSALFLGLKLNVCEKIKAGIPNI